jgi:hypothetical protein
VCIYVVGPYIITKSVCIYGVDTSLELVYIHTYTITRNIPLDKAMELLNKAKNGDPLVSVSMARKAGITVGKLATKDIASGQKNPARRLKQIWAGTLAQQQTMLGDNVEATAAEYKAYESSLTAVNTAGLEAKEWVAATVKQAISDLFDIVNVAEGCHNILKMRVTAMDIAVKDSRKDKQAVERTSRGEVRRLLKPWEQTKLPAVWRMQLHAQGLTLQDPDAIVSDEDAYTKYVPSQPAVAGPMPLLSDWSKPMWFADAPLGVGAWFIIVSSSFVMLFNDVVMQSCIGCCDVISLVYVFLNCIPRRQRLRPQDLRGHWTRHRPEGRHQRRKGQC